MSPHPLHHDHTARRGDGFVAAVWLDSGITPGLIVVDANRPALAGIARGLLLKQSVVAH